MYILCKRLFITCYICEAIYKLFMLLYLHEKSIFLIGNRQMQINGNDLSLRFVDRFPRPHTQKRKKKEKEKEKLLNGTKYVFCGRLACLLKVYLQVTMYIVETSFLDVA